MNKKLPSVYKGSDCTHIKNNKSVFCSRDSNINYSENDRTSNNVKEVEYIFNTPVTIKTNKEVIYAKIVSKVGDHILTSNNKIINLEDIQSIN